MKHLQSFNELYTRTIGFRYSEPQIEMELTAIFDGDLEKELIQEAFEYFDIKIDNIYLSYDSNKLNIQDEFDGWFTINFFVYNDRKIDMSDLIDSIIDFLLNKGFLIKPITFNKK
jgi:hypothetical protein